MLSTQDNLLFLKPASFIQIINDPVFIALV